MKINLVDMNGYKARMYKTNKYTSFLASFMFEMDYTRRNAVLVDLLLDYLLETNKKYKTKEALDKEFRENYGIRTKMYNYNKGKKLFVELLIIFVDPTKIKEEYLDRALHFVHDLFYNINKTNSLLNSKALKQVREEKIDIMGSDLSYPTIKASNKFRKSVYKDSEAVLTEYFDSKKEYADFVNSFTDKDIIDMHSYLIEDCFVGCNLMGDYRKKDLALVKKYFPFRIHKCDTDYSYSINFDNVPKYIEYSDKTISTSYLTVVYRVKDYDKKDRELFLAINSCLNEVGMLLHRILREEYQLVYKANSRFLSTTGVLEVNAEISKENEQKAVEAIDEIFTRLRDTKTIKDLLAKGRREVKISNYIEDESYINVFNRMEAEYFKFRLKKSVNTKKYMSIKEKDVIRALDLLEKVTVFIYRGDK